MQVASWVLQVLNHTTSEKGTPSSAPSLIGEIYLSLYVVFFRISGWESNGRVHSAVAAVSIVDGLIALSLETWAEVIAGRSYELREWLIGGTFLALYFLNHYFLFARGNGIAFEEKFDSFPKRKRIALRLAALGMLLSAAAATYVSSNAYLLAFYAR